MSIVHIDSSGLNFYIYLIHVSVPITSSHFSVFMWFHYSCYVTIFKSLNMIWIHGLSEHITSSCYSPCPKLNSIKAVKEIDI